jgi:hypothetical protein
MNRRNFLLLSALSPVMAKDYVYLDNDIFLNHKELKVLKILDSRLKKVKRFVGFGNFNYISLDRTLFYGRNYPSIGEFTRYEIALIEKLFYSDPRGFGFYGERTAYNISQKILKKDIKKILYSGHYIYKGKPLDDYNRIIKDVGDNLILTSGVRNVVKQLSLYVSKINKLYGNISKASTIIAPPSFSYHTISDFDVGKKGWGFKNFTSAFARTLEFQEIRKLDYIGIRYTRNNKDGVRFEPWHIKVI